MSSQDARPTFVRLHNRRLDRSVPPELVAALTLEPSDICRAGSLGFTARLSAQQRAEALRQPLVFDIEDNPNCLAPISPKTANPDVPNRWVVRVRALECVETVSSQVDLHAADVLVTGVWLYATVTDEQLIALRRLPEVDFVAPAVMVDRADA